MVTQKMKRTHEGKWVFSEKKIRFVIFDYLIQIREIVPICAPTFELPSNTSTMTNTKGQHAKNWRCFLIMFASARIYFPTLMLHKQASRCLYVCKAFISGSLVTVHRCAKSRLLSRLSTEISRPLPDSLTTAA